ncbi:hypothetical protein STAS_30959 [Striga asiatica]|uniref:Uncharacterized protein n=1 Tax=Striga asiatica TaxID=4170 RepID=A0A5A7RA35_STRAF|nr:hypothetical protein STAS_30959 [Striga asiatica]
MTRELSKPPPASFSPAPSLSFSSAPSAAGPSVPSNWSNCLGVANPSLTRFLKDGSKATLQRYRSMGANGNLKMTSKPLGKKTKAPPSPDEVLLGAVIAAVFGVLLYKFTTTIEFSLNSQKLSNNYSVRQITITIRTIIHGLCYLATFVFGFNSVGLFLYSGQLALNSTLVEEGPNGEVNVPLNTSSTKDVDNSETTKAGEEQTLDKTVKHKNEEYK